MCFVCMCAVLLVSANLCIKFVCVLFYWLVQFYVFCSCVCCSIVCVCVLCESSCICNVFWNYDSPNVNWSNFTFVVLFQWSSQGLFVRFLWMNLPTWHILGCSVYRRLWRFPTTTWVVSGCSGQGFGITLVSISTRYQNFEYVYVLVGSPLHGCGGKRANVNRQDPLGSGYTRHNTRWHNIDSYSGSEGQRKLTHPLTL